MNIVRSQFVITVGLFGMMMISPVVYAEENSADLLRSVLAIGRAGDRSPVPDGVIGKDEYPTSVDGLIDLQSHKAYEHAATTYYAASPQGLFVGVQLTLPKKYKLKKLEFPRNLIDRGDNINIILRFPKEEGSKAYDAYGVTIAPDGSAEDYWETVDWGYPGGLTRDWNYTQPIKTAGKQNGRQWVIEAFIPWPKVLRISEQTQFMFSLGVKLNERRLAYKDHVVWFDHPQAFTVASVANFVQTVRYGESGSGAFEEVVRMYNPSNATVKGNIRSSIISPQLGEEGTAIFEERIIEGISMKSLGALKTWNKAFSLKSDGTEVWKGDLSIEKPGEYMAVTRITAGDTPMFQRAYPLVVHPSISVKFDKSFEKKRLNVNIRIHGRSKQQREKLLDGKVTLRFATKGKLIAEKTLDAKDGGISEELDTSQWPAGEYDVTVTCKSRKRDIQLDANEKWMLPGIPPWLKHRLGLEALKADWVPEGWTPCECTKDSVSVWKKTFKYGRGFMEQITVDGQAILSRPMEVFYQSEGKKHSLKISKIDIRKLGEGRAQVDIQAASPDVSVRNVQTIEFDGFVKMDVEIHSKGKKTIDQLWMELDLADAYLMNISQRKGTPSWLSGKTADMDLGYVIGLWLGNDDCGLAFNTQNYKNWQIDSQKPRVALRTKGEGESTLRLNFVNTPVTMKTPAELAFSLTATPVRPRAAQWRNFRFDGWGAKKPYPVNAVLGMTRFWSNATNRPVPRSWEAMKQFVDYLGKKKQRLYPYLCGFYLSPYKTYIGAPPSAPEAPDRKYFRSKRENSEMVPEYEHYARDWMTVPLNWNNWSGGKETTLHSSMSAGSGYVDYYVYSVAELLKKSGIGGIYVDLAVCGHPNMDESRGMTYTTLDGVKEGMVELFAARDHYKRVYWVLEKYRGTKNQPYLIAHSFPAIASTMAFWPILMHAEELVPNEPYGFTKYFLQERSGPNERNKIWTTPADPDVKRTYDAYTYRAGFGSQFGPRLLFIAQYGKPNEMTLRKNRPCARELLSYTFLNDTPIWPLRVSRAVVYEFWRKVRAPMDKKEWTFTAYFRDKVKTNNPAVKVSYWLAKDGKDAVIAVANWSEKDIDAKIQLPEELKWIKTLRNMESGKELDVSRAFETTIPSHELRVFRSEGK